MKKKIVALLAGAMMTLAASSAFAAYTSASLEVYRAVWDSTTNTKFEAITDLGSIASLKGLAAGSNANLGTTFQVGSYATANAADLRVAYFAYDTATQNVYFGQTGATGSEPISGAWTSSGVGLLTVTNYYKNGTTGFVKSGDSVTNTNTGTTGGNLNTSSFAKKEGPSFGSFQTQPALTALNLATLANTTQTNIWQFNGATGGTGSKVTTAAGAELFLTTDVATGMTTAHAVAGSTPTPLPAAAYLLGSGLLGLVGVRRKTNKA